MSETDSKWRAVNGSGNHWRLTDGSATAIIRRMLGGLWRCAVSIEGGNTREVDISSAQEAAAKEYAEKMIREMSAPQPAPGVNTVIELDAAAPEGTALEETVIRILRFNRDRAFYNIVADLATQMESYGETGSFSGVGWQALSERFVAPVAPESREAVDLGALLERRAEAAERWFVAFAPRLEDDMRQMLTEIRDAEYALLEAMIREVDALRTTQGTRRDGDAGAEEVEDDAA